ncbi:hypothetical protein OIU78_012054 [Salix suchowensis]|nr:hypothetical protein OIU78_012054 [Salix suchowensis]
MKRASFVGILTTTTFYILCGCLGYAAFGNDAPGNFLTGFGFYEPFVLVDLANVCIAIHLIGAYQVFCQPIFSFVESRCHGRWPDSKFITKMYMARSKMPKYSFTWTSLKMLSWACLVISLVSAAGSIEGLIRALKTYKPFKAQQ